MKIAVLFDGAGLARLGLERAGHDCTGFEIDPSKHYLSKLLGSGNSILADATKVDLSGYDAVWASPPCQFHSRARDWAGLPKKQTYSSEGIDYLEWSLNIQTPVLWVENVISAFRGGTWGTKYNAAQFLEVPIQNRNRIIGGRYLPPPVTGRWKQSFGDICPCITATEYKRGGSPKSRGADRWYGRKLTIAECAYHQGLEYPPEWLTVPNGYSLIEWRNNLYEAIGNGVPVYMAEAFGRMYPPDWRPGC